MEEIQPKNFDYSILNENEKLATLENEKKLNEIFEKYQPEVGEILYNQQQVMSKHGNGIFQSWYESKGFNRGKVYQYINKYKFLNNIEELSNKDIFQNAPISLQNEMSKPSAKKEVNQAVYSGDITSRKEYKEMENRVKKAEQKAQQAQQQAESERKERERLEEESENIEPEIKEIYIEDEERINNLTKEIEKINDQKEQMENRLKSSENDAEKYRKLQDDIDKLRNEKEDVIRQIDNVSSIGKFISRVERSFEEDLAPVKYSRAIEELERSEVAQESLETIVSKVEKWCNEMRTIMKNNNITEVIEHE